MTRASSLVAAVALAGGVIALMAACADERIVLATLPPAFDGGSPSAPRRCVDDKECGAAELCSRAACADVAGSCEPAPVFCEEEGHPVCGCDGVTYWNDCLRRSSGITAMTVGECGYNARICRPAGKGPPPPPGAEDDCPSGTFCAHLLPVPRDVPPSPELCGPDAPGTCWALPAVCPDRAGPDRWISCGAIQGACTTTCDAIRSGAPYKRANACP